MDVSQQEALKDIARKRLDKYEQTLLENRLATDPDVQNMTKRLSDFLLVSNGKNQGQLNYMQKFLQDFIHQLSKGTQLDVGYLKEKLYDQKHMDVNLEKFRKKIVS